MTPSPERGAILHGEVRIEYTVVRSRRRRRTIGITIVSGPSTAGKQQGAVGAVVVRAPLRASRAVVEDVLRRKAEWIARKVEELTLRQEAADGRGWDADWGHNGYGMDTAGRAICAEGYESYRERALVVLEAAVGRWAPRVGSQPSRVLVRNQKRIWGSCSRDGTLRLNWRLVTLEPSLIDYVVVHELVHLRVRSHAREFWSAVAELLPDFRERRKRLRQRAWIEPQMNAD